MFPLEWQLAHSWTWSHVQRQQPFECARSMCQGERGGELLSDGAEPPCPSTNQFSLCPSSLNSSIPVCCVCFSKHLKSFYGVKWGRKHFEPFGWCCLLPCVSCPPTHFFLASCFPSLSYIGFISFLPNTQLFALPAVWEHPSGVLTLLFQ